MLIDCEKLATSIQNISDELQNHNDECDTISIYYDRSTDLIMISVSYCGIKNTGVLPAYINKSGIKIYMEWLIRSLIKYTNKIEEN